VPAIVDMPLEEGEEALASVDALLADVLGAAGAAPTRVATHLLAGGPRGNHATVEALRTAARDAMAQGAPEAAATYRARALAEPPADADRTGVTLELGPALARARPAESRTHLLAVIGATDDDGEFTVAALALTYAMPQDFDQCAAITLRAIDRIADERARRRLELARIALAGDGLLRSDSTVSGMPCNVRVKLDRFDEALAALDTALAHAPTGFLAKFTI
jgi:tetratricopeptide (TPR) repeat protein